MARYKLCFRKSVARDLRSIPTSDVRRILDRIDGLADNPRGPGCIRLTGNDCYRARQGQYRIVYQIRDQQLLVMVIKVAHRSVVYKKL